MDAQLPRRLAVQLCALGHDAVHTMNLEAGNRTSDRAICIAADASEAAVITKDADFVINRVCTDNTRSGGTEPRIINRSCVASGKKSDLPPARIDR